MTPSSVDRAFAFLDAHSVYEKSGRIDSPSTANIERLVQLMGDPHLAYRTIHITGTNGKGSTSQMVTRLLMSHGLTVGTYTSPHLERVNERMMINGQPVNDDELAENVLAIAELESLVEGRLSYFDIMTAVAFRWFANTAVDVGVIEVGLLGRWDATNVVQSDVAVLTNVTLPHRVRRPDARTHRPGEGRHRETVKRFRAGRDKARPRGDFRCCPVQPSRYPKPSLRADAQRFGGGWPLGVDANNTSNL